MAYRLHAVLTLRCQQHQVLAVQMCSPHDTYVQKDPGQSGEFPSLELWASEPQLCQYPKTQHWFEDLWILWSTGLSVVLHKLVWAEFTISGWVGALHTVGKVTFLSDDPLCSEHTDICGHTPLQLVAATGEGKIFFNNEKEIKISSEEGTLREEKRICHKQTYQKQCFLNRKKIITKGNLGRQEERNNTISKNISIYNRLSFPLEISKFLN